MYIYNTLSGTKETFVPIISGQVRMYVCGMTVYDYCHLGHARVLVVFDMVSRWLRASGYSVTYVRNITDIDDKIIKRATENGESISVLTERFIRFMNEDADKLGVERPNFQPRATEHVSGMITMICRLIERGLAYVANNGDVYYSVRDFPGYGKLSGKSLEHLRAGERVEIEVAKQDPLDFVLWKATKLGEPSWESPWGPGRPGWHIECSVMGLEQLGESFDIHGGGQDLQFPHHENEIAQSEGCFGHQHVNYWMHNGFLSKDAEKMSKSLGNFSTIRDVLQKYDPEVVRFFILRTHYRSPLNYSDQHLDDARSALTRLYTAIKIAAPATAEAIDWGDRYPAAFKAAMDDDFGTPVAFSVLFQLAAEINRTGDVKLAAQLKELGAQLGLLQRNPLDFLQALPELGGGMSEKEIMVLIEARADAKRVKNYVEADRIRNKIATAGGVLEDSKNGTTWRRDHHQTHRDA